MKKYFINSLWLVIDKAFSLIGAFFITVLVARHLGPDKMGIFNFVLAITAIMAPICQLGAEHIVFNRVARNKKSGWLLIDKTKYLRLFLYFISSLFILIYVLKKDYSTEEQLIYVLLLIAGFFSSQDIYRIYFNGTLRSKINSTSSQLALYSSLIFRFALVKMSAATVLFALPFVMTTSIGYFIRRYFFYKEDMSEKDLKRSEKRYSAYYFKSGLPLMISGLSVVIYTRISQIILGEYVDVSSVAIFNSSLKLSQVWIFIPLAIITSLMTKVLSEGKDNNKIRGFGFLYLITVSISIPVISLLSYFNYEIIFFTYGIDYIDAAEYITLLSISSMFSLIGTVSVKAMVVYGARKYLMFKMISMAILNVLLCLYLIPIYGIKGAALSVLITEITSATLANYFYRNFFLMKVQCKSLFAVTYYKRITK